MGASKHCISSSGQVLNLCDPARDYGGSGGKGGVWNSPLKPNNCQLRVFVCVFVSYLVSLPVFFVSIWCLALEMKQETLGFMGEFSNQVIHWMTQIKIIPPLCYLFFVSSLVVCMICKIIFPFVVDKLKLLFGTSSLCWFWRPLWKKWCIYARSNRWLKVWQRHFSALDYTWLWIYIRNFSVPSQRQTPDAVAQVTSWLNIWKPFKCQNARVMRDPPFDSAAYGWDWVLISACRVNGSAKCR